MSERLSPGQVRKIDAILAAAARQGRQRLLEHEVYEILLALGLQVPTYMFVPDPDELTAGILCEFGTERLILKVVSSEIAHKTRVGGVRRVVRDRERIRAAMRQMKREICAHPQFAGREPKVEGFLLSSFVEYSKDLGNEVLVGAKENFAFGPALSFSKGGTDAEHFARYFSSPNIRLLPLDRAGCRAMLGETAIARKYREEGNEDFLELIADAVAGIGALFEHYSSLNPQPGEFIFSEFEINPFVIDEERNLVAIDGLAQFLPSSRRLDLLAGPRPQQLDALFWPEGVAVVGVSTSDPTKIGNNIATLLHNLGREDLFLVNARGGRVEIGGRCYELYRSVREIPERVDLVVVCVPAPLAPGVAEEARDKGARGLVLIPGGFGEVEGGASLEQQILEIVRDTPMRVVGPNCLGIFRAPVGDRPGINTLFVPEEKLEYRPRTESNVALLTQSGALGISELDKLKSAIYPRVVVSYGNQLDVDPADLVAYLADDPAVDVIGVYIEGFKPCGGRKFFDAVRACRKPVIVYKAGRTDAGSRAAASHTASMTGDYKVALAAMKQAGAIVADHILDHTDLRKTCSLLADKRIGGRRVAGVVNAGFESTYAADSIGDLVLAEFSADTAAALREALPPFVSVNPFLDLTPMADDATFERCIELALADPGVDELFISVVPHTVALHTMPEEVARDRENLAERIVRQARRSHKPVVVSVNAGTMYNAFIEALEQGGVPTYTTAERAMKALNRLVDYRLGR